MAKRMLIDALHPEEMRVVIADERQIYDFDFASTARKQVKGNIYLAKITRVEPSLQAAFVEYGGGKQGFLPFAEIHPDYYQIPMSDRQRLMEEAERDDASTLVDEAEAAHAEETPATMEAFPAQDGGMAEGDSLIPDFPAAALPPEITPDQTHSQDAPAPEEPEDRGIAFASGEVVAAQTTENEQLAQNLAEEESVEGEKKEGEEGVETIASEEEEQISQQRRKRNFFRRYKIQEVIKRGQVVLVQVIKEERGNKGVSLTTFLSLAGRYCVLMPNSPKDGGISRKISDGETRKRLKDLLSELKLANNMSVIIRTAGIDRTRAEIRRDFDYLVKVWNQVRENTLGSTAPALIYEESDVIKRAIRDQYTNDIDEVIVEGADAYHSARDFMKLLLPSHTPRVKQYKESMPLFHAYGVEDQLLAMHDPAVKLRSGGYIVIGTTEALIAIDVNSGRSTGERNIEETATKTNLEAAVEVARQLRLRDLAGLIVIDFIDMYESRNRRAVERALKDALKNDRAKIQLGRISPFGLLEMSRQRLRPSVAETNNITCPHCNGRGHIRSNESMSIQIIRSLEREAATGNWGALKLNAPEAVALHLLNTKRTMLEAIERRHEVAITVNIDHALTSSAFTVEKNRRSFGGERTRNERPERDNQEFRRRDGRRGRRDEREQREEPVNEEIVETAAEEPTDSDTESASREDGGRRNRRGRRGGRNRRRGGRYDENESSAPQESEDGAFAADAAEPVESDVVAETDAPQEDRSPRERGERGGRRRGQRGGRGRGRRRWNEGEEGNGAEGNGAEAPAEAEFQTEPPQESLPSFTREPAMQLREPELVVKQEITHRPAPLHAEPPPSTKRPEGAPPRKGWWQKIIELE